MVCHPRLALDIFYVHTKFGDYHFSRFGDMTAGIEIKNGLCDPDYATFRGGLSSVS